MKWLSNWGEVTLKEKAKVIGIILAYFFLQMSLFTVLQPYLSFNWLTVVITLVTTPFLLWLAWRSGFDIGDWRDIDRQIVLKAIGWALALNIGLIVYQLILASFGYQLGDTANQADLNELSMQLPKWVSLLVFAVVGPILEEVLFRSLLMRYLFPKWPLFGVLFVTYLFATAHGHRDFVELGVYFGMGLVLAFAYLKERRLAFPILIHVFNNLYAAILMLWFS